MDAELIPARVRGGSMHPLLPSGTEVLIRPLSDCRSLRPGEVIACRARGGRLVLHRFRGFAERGRLITRGDTHGRPDPPWPSRCLVGRVEFVRPARGPWLRPRFFIARLALFVSFSTGTGMRRLGLRLLRLAAFTPANEVFPPKAPASGRRYRGMSRFETQQLGNQLAVYDADTGNVTLLSAMAHAIWQAARSGLGRDDIRTLILDRYPGVDPAIVDQDLQDSWNRLESAHLLS